MRLFVSGTVLAAAVAAIALTPLTSAQAGVFSGNNGLIAYTCGSNICTINADGSAGHTSLVTGASDPSWSSDEDSIAYLSGTTGITVADSDGTDPQQLGAAALSTQPSFSFDGDRVAYVRGGAIFTIQSNGGGGELPLLTSPSTDADPAYSPDGTKVAFARDDGATGFDIWTVTLSSGVLHQVTNVSGNERNPTWSPSGLTLVYSAGVVPGLWASASSGPVNPTPSDLHAPGTQPAYSPDGTKIAFINASGNLAVMPASISATPTITVLDNTAGNAQPDWQSVFAPPSSGGAPVNVSYPSVNLSFDDTVPTVGDFLTASIGTWSGAFPISYTYQWKRCDGADPVNGQCVDIVTAKSSFYTPVAADYGKRLRVQVTATNAQGSARQNSEVTAIVTAEAPVLRVTPQIIGGNIVDSPITLTAGTWDGSVPLTYTYSWRRCNPAGDLPSCVQIPGATLATYTPVVADIGFAIRVWITGSNLAGSALAVTNHTFPVVDKQHFSPSSITAPSIVGTMNVGRQLTASTGSFDGDDPITTTFVWQRCDATGAACRVIAGAKKVVYHPTMSDVGLTIRLAVTAKNAYGTTVSMSDPTEPVLLTPPHRKGRQIVGNGKGEYLAGGGYDDDIQGMGGNDTLLGGAGDDQLDGGNGGDVITGGAGADKIFGGAGSDTIYAADGERDVIDCGDGRDRAVVDTVDIVKNCEVVQTASSSGSGGGSTPTPTPTPTPPGDDTKSP